MYYLIIINFIAFILCYIDKVRAIKSRYRISEDILLFLCLIGGCFGFYVGMHLFHHKTRKLIFKLIYLFMGLWLFIIYYSFTK